MLKHAKIVFKEFGSSFGRFMAITGIIALGVAIMMGLSFVTPDMKNSYNEYFANSNYYDYTIYPAVTEMPESLSADDFMGMTPGEIGEAIDELNSLAESLPNDGTVTYIEDELKNNDIDATVEGVVNADVYYSVPGETAEKAVRVFSVGENGKEGLTSVNSLTLIEGEWPTDIGEVVAVTPFRDMYDIAVGDVLTYGSGNADDASLVPNEGNELKVVGIASSPLYFSQSNESCTIGNGTVDIIVFGAKGTIDAEIASFPDGLMGGVTYTPYYTALWVDAGGTVAQTAFTEDYDGYSASVQQLIESFDGSDDWYVLNRKTNTSYYSMSVNIDKVAQIAGIFPVFFIVIAALVAFSTIVRMVDDDRGQIGTLRSLGYNGSQIVGKYIFYSVMAAILGCIISVPFGAFLIPLVLWNAYGSMYMLPTLLFSADWLFCVIAFVGTVAAVILVTAGACWSSLRETPASILQPRAPKPGKRILLERTPIWKRLSFKFKAMFRNIFRFKRNLIMTVLSVAGCSALILAGFGLMNTMNAVNELQFEQIFSYDLEIGVKSGYESSADYDTLAKYLGDESNHISIYEANGTLYCGENNENSDTINIIVTDNATLNGYMEIEGTYDADSVIISEGLHRAYGIGEGDSVFVRLSTGESATLKVTGVTTIYSQCWLFLGSNSYETAFGQSVPENNTILVRSTDSAENADTQSAAKQELYSLDCVSGVTFTDDMKELFDNIMSTIGLVTLVLVVAAGMLVIIVLYNLTNINICERRKEIATLKVLGYRRREVSGYVFREIMVLVIFGVIFGIGMGLGLLAFILNGIGSSFMIFPFSVSWWSYVVTIALTFLFSGLVDLMLLPKLNKINMADSMKAVD